MKKIILTSVAIGFLLTGMGSIVHADPINVNVYKVGSNPGGLAINYNNGLATNNEEATHGGVPYIEWTFENVPTAGEATLTITAEGVDSGEWDQVFFNGLSIGFLTQQITGTPSYTINPGSGVVPYITDLTISEFTVFAIKGLNTVRVNVAQGNWVNEIQTSTLTVNPVPEPTTFLLFGSGLAGLAAVGRKKRN